MNKKYFKLISGTIVALCVVIGIGFITVYCKDGLIKNDNASESSQSAKQKTALSKNKKNNSSENDTAKDKKLKSNKVTKDKNHESDETKSAKVNQNNQASQSNQNAQSSQDEKSSQGAQSGKGTSSSQGAQGSQGASSNLGTPSSQGTQSGQEAQSSQGAQGSLGAQSSSGAQSSQVAQAAQGTQNNQSKPDAQEKPKPQQASNPNVSPRWLYYNSRIKKGIDNSAKPVIDEKVRSWTNYQMSDTEIFEWLDKYICEELGGTINSMGVMSNDRYLIPDINSLPNYDAALSEGNYQYCFTGVYTKGEYNEYGDLICYMWQITII